MYVTSGQCFSSEGSCRVRMKNGDAVVMVAAPAAGGFERPTAGDHGAGGHVLVDDLAVDATRSTCPLDVGVVLVGRHLLLDETLASVTEAVVHTLVRAGNEPVERGRHEEHRCGHSVSFLRRVAQSDPMQRDVKVGT
jgi:hypothetical protein